MSLSRARSWFQSCSSPPFVLAPMVDQSDFAWRSLVRSFSPQLIAYSPMIHAMNFVNHPKYRASNFQATLHDSLVSSPISIRYCGCIGTHFESGQKDVSLLDGHIIHDRPLIVQFCANNPQTFRAAFQHVTGHCDAVDLNLGCPQGIARRGKYGAFLQDDWPVISSLLRSVSSGRTLAREADTDLGASACRSEEHLPLVTAKIRIFRSRKRLLMYARMLIESGASILTVHGRTREQIGQNTGAADWRYIRYLRDSLPDELVLFANGSVWHPLHVERCLRATRADAVMCGESLLANPCFFASSPPTAQSPLSPYYFEHPTQTHLSGWRIDRVFRQYLDIIYRDVLHVNPPEEIISEPCIRCQKLHATGESWNTDDMETLLKPIVDREVGNKDSPWLQYTRNPATRSPSLIGVTAHLHRLLQPIFTKYPCLRELLKQAPRTGEWKYLYCEGCGKEVSPLGVLGNGMIVAMAEQQNKDTISEREQFNQDITQYGHKIMAGYEVLYQHVHHLTELEIGRILTSEDDNGRRQTGQTNQGESRQSKMAKGSLTGFILPWFVCQSRVPEGFRTQATHFNDESYDQQSTAGIQGCGDEDRETGEERLEYGHGIMKAKEWRPVKGGRAAVALLLGRNEAKDRREEKERLWHEHWERDYQEWLADKTYD